MLAKAATSPLFNPPPPAPPRYSHCDSNCDWQGASSTGKNNDNGSDNNNLGDRGDVSALRNPARPNMTTEEFTRMMDAAEKDIQVVKVLTSPPSAGSPAATGDAQPRTAKKKSFPGTGGRSGTGRTSGGGGGGGGGVKKMAGTTRRAAASGGRGGSSGGGGGRGSGRVVPVISRDADRVVLRSDSDSEDTDTDVSTILTPSFYVREKRFSSEIDPLHQPGDGIFVPRKRETGVEIWTFSLANRVFHNLYTVLYIFKRNRCL